jgi:antitoxin ParD1/3/4
MRREMVPLSFPHDLRRRLNALSDADFSSRERDSGSSSRWLFFARFCYHRLVNISLTVEMRAFLEAEVGSGAYATTSEVVRDAIRLYQRRKAEDSARLEALRNELALGLAEADRGDLLTVDAASVRGRGRERLAAKTAPSE